MFPTLSLVETERFRRATPPFPFSHTNHARTFPCPARRMSLKQNPGSVARLELQVTRDGFFQDARCNRPFDSGSGMD